MKNIADALTGLRLVLVPFIAWISWTWGQAAGAGKVALLTMLAWTTDALDGPIARRAARPTRLGRYDWTIDVGLASVLALTLVMWGVLPALLVGGVVAVASGSAWALRDRVPLIVAMGLVYLTFVLAVWQTEPGWGRALVGWGALDVLLRPGRTRRDIAWFLGRVNYLLGRTPAEPKRSAK